MFAQKHCNYRHSAIETLPLFIEGVPEGGGSICAARDYLLKKGNKKENRSSLFTFCPVGQLPLA